MRTTIFLLICNLLCLLNMVQAQSNNVLDANEFEKGIIISDSVQILDVRTPEEYRSGHLKSALLADWKDEQEFERRVSFVDKDKPVYLYCLSGGRSSEAAKKLRSMGFKNVYDLKGGINAWKAGNKSVVGRSGEKQMSLAEFNTSINKTGIVLVDFGAEWCPPCRKMEPVLNNLAANNPGKFKLVKVDGGKDELILQEYQVISLPVFILFKNGKQIWRRDGIVTEKEISDQLQ